MGCVIPHQCNVVNIPHQTNVGLKEKCLASYNNDEHIKACR